MLALKRILCPVRTVAFCVLSCSLRVSADTFYVSDAAGNPPDAVEKIDSGGNRSIFALGGDTGRPLWGAEGLAFDSSGNLYVASYDNGNVVKYDGNGNATIFASGLLQPTGLVFDGSGNLYVACYGDGSGTNGTIQKFDTNGNGSTFASFLRSPEALAYANGNIYVSNYGFGQILKYDSNGNVSLFASVNTPEGLAFDSSGNLLVASYGSGNNGVIDKLDSNGNVSFFANAQYPKGLAFDSIGNLYAANVNGGLIEKYDSNGNGSVFVSDLLVPRYIAMQVPEPSTWSLLLFAVVSLAGIRIGRSG
jgi:sugar lactone lactonase YvrE